MNETAKMARSSCAPRESSHTNASTFRAMSTKVTTGTVRRGLLSRSGIIGSPQAPHRRGWIDDLNKRAGSELEARHRRQARKEIDIPVRRAPAREIDEHPVVR